MRNSIEAYQESGRKAGRARRAGDEGMAEFEFNWMRRAVNLENTPEDRQTAKQAFESGYSGSATPRRPSVKDV